MAGNGKRPVGSNQRSSCQPATAYYASRANVAGGKKLCQHLAVSLWWYLYVAVASSISRVGWRGAFAVAAGRLAGFLVMLSGGGARPLVNARYKLAFNRGAMIGFGYCGVGRASRVYTH